jgi:hypothetical protein
MSAGVIRISKLQRMKSMMMMTKSMMLSPTLWSAEKDSTDLIGSSGASKE